MNQLLLRIRRKLFVHKDKEDISKKIICNTNWDSIKKELSPEIQNIKNTLIEIPYDFDYEE